jgi:vacuolar-type H+-ATPase subunit B/Vma2
LSRRQALLFTVKGNEARKLPDVKMLSSLQRLQDEMYRRHKVQTDQSLPSNLLEKVHAITLEKANLAQHVWLVGD